MGAGPPRGSDVILQRVKRALAAGGAGEPWVLKHSVDVQCQTIKTISQTVVLNCICRNSAFLLRLESTSKSVDFVNSKALCTEEEKTIERFTSSLAVSCQHLQAVLRCISPAGHDFPSMFRSQMEEESTVY